MKTSILISAVAISIIPIVEFMMSATTIDLAMFALAAGFLTMTIKAVGDSVRAA